MKSLRGWQAEALPSIFEHIDERPLVRAVMGSGKSVLIAELVKHVPDTLQVVITTPAVRLVDDLADTLKDWAGIEAGRWYTHAKDAKAVTVCCNDSLPSLVEELGSKEVGVELWIADEAHKTECDTMKQAVERMNPYRRVGFTATPWRADSSQRLSLFDTLAYNYTAAEAFADGVVVPPRVRHYRGSADTLNEACVEAIRGAVAEKLGPGLVNARNIEDAQEFAALLGKHDISARCVHSKLDPGVQRHRMAALKAGDLHCLVHIDMLAEGINLPWLRWLCCRRPVGSPVRFAQEVGRVLRAHPGKNHAVIFDPHNLFGVFALDGEAVLSGAEDEDPIRLPALHLDFLCGQIREEPSPPETYRGVPVQLIDPTTSYLVKLHLQFQFAGIIDPEIKSTHWRTESPSDRQIELVRKLEGIATNAQGVPEEQRKALEVACAAAPGLNKGAVSDLIDLLMVIRKRGWPANFDEEVL